MVCHRRRVLLFNTVALHHQSSCPRAGGCVDPPDGAGPSQGTAPSRNPRGDHIRALCRHVPSRVDWRGNWCKHFRRANMVALDVLELFYNALRTWSNWLLPYSLSGTGRWHASRETGDNFGIGYPWDHDWHYVPWAFWLCLGPGSCGGLAATIPLDHIEKPLIPSSALSLEVFWTLVALGCGWACFGIWSFYTWQFVERLRSTSPLLVSSPNSREDRHADRTTIRLLHISLLLSLLVVLLS